MKNRDVRWRMTGFSLPVIGGGASWAKTDGTKVSARRVLSFLEDRRVLFNPYWSEEAGACVASVLEVRRMLTAEIGGLASDEVLVAHLQTMRALCRAFLDQIRASTDGDRHDRLRSAFQPLDERDFPLVIALGELRSAMGIQIGLIAATFDLDVPDTLVAILPPPPDSDDGADLDFDLDPAW